MKKERQWLEKKKILHQFGKGLVKRNVLTNLESFIFVWSLYVKNLIDPITKYGDDH